MIRHIALVGMPGCGKTSVGRRVAALTGLPFVDTDAAVEAREGTTIAAIFAERGEAGFRLAERAAIAAALEGPPAVLALGGGAFANPQTHALVRRGARTLWLRASLETLVERVGTGTKRPLLAGDPRAALARLLPLREPYYARADHVLEGESSPDTRAAQAVAALARAPPVKRVPVGPPGYEVLVGPGLLARAGEHIRAAGAWRRALIVADANVAPLYADALADALTAAGLATERTTVSAGEASKSWDGLRTLVEAFAAARLARTDLVVALGGGVIGDLTGFAAAIYMRGLDWVQVPTTLLAQVDSSVGGKTAIDLAAGKNLAGAFHDPALVLADTDTLATLPAREMRSGYAEVVKYGLLGDARFFEWLEDHGESILAREPAPLAAAVAHCVRMKAQIVTDDPHEHGRRALLNLGHTFAHALEAECGFGDALTHGEAVALGCALAFRFSEARDLCPPMHVARACEVLREAGLPTRLSHVDHAFGANALVERMRNDKKAGSGGALTFILARGIGEAFVEHDAQADAVVAFLRGEGAA